MSEAILKKTSNWFRAVGTLSEKNLKKEECQVKIYENGKPTGESVDAECIKGKVSVRFRSGVQTFPIYFASMGMDGKNAKNWKMAEAIYEKWNPEIGGNADEEATMVAIEGVAEPNDYVAQSGELRYALNYRVRSANTRLSAEEQDKDNHGMTLSVTAFIKSIKPEIRNEEETGRLMVELYGANNKGACFPINAIVEKELAEDFDDAYEAGQTVDFDIDVVNKHIGGSKGGKKAFGHSGTVNTNSGFDITELVIAGADYPIEEPDELTYEDDEGNIKEVETKWINPKTMKAALKVRAAMLEELEKAGPVDYSKKSGSKSLAERKAEKRANKMPKTKATAKPSFEDDDFEDDPF